jgi:putative PIG3 family NAD(P)H quinone oxidoreductase
MRAIVYTGVGGTEVIALREVATPTPTEGQVRVRVVATALNRADIVQRLGAYPAPPGAVQDIPGLEFAGVVDAVGSGVDERWIGREVCGIAAGGTYAEYVCVHHGLCFERPEGVSLIESAAIAEAFVTAHDALVTIGGAREGSAVLVHAVGSGVGVAAVQIASALGARVVGTARTESKRVRAKAFALEAAIDAESFEAPVKALFERGADVIVDFVGAKYLEANTRLLASRGRLVIVGLLGGARAELDLGQLLRKRARIEGTVLRSRSDQEKSAAVRAFAEWAAPRWASGALRPVVDRVLPLERAAEAQEAMSANDNFGKIVLTV